ncbi:MAG: HNH endonuclease signature motif containing protein [Candidatus Micrarchaeaceae archaeon]|jgi:uncharacterized CHY-type Zn-finger protein
MEHQFFNEFKFYLDKQTGYWITTNCPKKRMHVVVWEFYKGKVPEGFHVHHKDNNKGNNDISNLGLLSEHEHLSLHMTEERRERVRKMAGDYRHLTKEWHASEEGRKWHKEHGILGWANRKPISLICVHCKKEFVTKSYHQLFCSNACKSAWRRYEGLDDVEAICVFCEKKFRKNKYAKVRTCSMSCAAKLRWSERREKKGK